MLLLKKLNIQSNGAHKQVHAAEALSGHGRRERLGQRNSVEDTVLDSQDEARLLVVVGADTHGGQELPDIDVLAGVDAAGEHIWQRGFDAVEQYFKGLLPVQWLVMGLKS